jgi:PAS domain S-box-containing protein
MSAAIDFERLFEAAPNAYMVLDRELRYVAVNATYLRLLQTRWEDLNNRRLFDIFPNDPDDPHNAPAQLLRKSLERVLASGENDHLAFIPYRVPRTVDGATRFEERYWSTTHCPIFDDAGRVVFVLLHVVDVTELHGELGAAPAESPGSDAVTRTGLLSRARAIQEENTRIDADREHLRTLFEQAPGFMCFLQGPEHVFSFANAAYLRLVGQRDIIGKPVRAALPELIGQDFQQLLDSVYATGEPFVGQDIRVLLQRQAGVPPDEAFVDFVYQPVLGPDGRARGIFVQGHDVTARKNAEREGKAARRAAEAFSEELVEQSHNVKAALDRATARIAELEAQIATR